MTTTAITTGTTHAVLLGGENLPGGTAVHAALRRYARELGLSALAEVPEVTDLLAALPADLPTESPTESPTKLPTEVPVGQVGPVQGGSGRPNWLCPGSCPAEVSFAETDPECLRLDIQPGSPGLTGAERARLACDLARVPDEAIRPWAGALSRATFGAFASVCVAPSQRRGRVYLELGQEAVAVMRGCPGAPGLLGDLPGLRPHLLAVDTVGRTRWYLEATGGLALLDLFELGDLLGVTHEVPALVHALHRLAGSTVLPPGVLLAVAATPGGGTELKIELAAPSVGPDAADVVGQLLADRPQSAVAYGRWRRAVATAPTVISTRIRTGTPGVRHNVYAPLMGGVR